MHDFPFAVLSSINVAIVMNRFFVLHMKNHSASYIKSFLIYWVMLFCDSSGILTRQLKHTVKWLIVRLRFMTIGGNKIKNE